LFGALPLWLRAENHSPFDAGFFSASARKRKRRFCNRGISPARALTEAPERAILREEKEDAEMVECADWMA
jgi:hypothetical protein